MPSIFSRTRTQSSPLKGPSATDINQNGAFDEFGRVTSRSSIRAVAPTTPVKKDKKKDKDKEKLKLRAISSATLRPEYESPQDMLAIADGDFLPLNLERPRDETGVEHPKEQDYGYLSYERHVVLGLEQVQRLVEVVSEELGTRGLTTPFIFSTLALDISSTAIKRLIQAFLKTCAHGPTSPETEHRWREEARFAGPHELGMCLRWGLARVVRYVGGQDVRGLISWDQYNTFRDTEAALSYPPAHFATLLPDLPPALGHVLLTVMTLLTRLTAHSASSGHTPPTLSPLFGPLIFGLGPATLAFHHTYVHYLRAANAMEHLILAFIRWQDAPRQVSADGISPVHGSATALGVPTRLKDWIRGYPQCLPFLHQRNKNNEKPQPRKGARTIRVISVRRNVRMYSPDLVKTAATWAQRPKVGVTPGERGLMGSKEWDRIAPPALKLPPRYSEAFKKRMDLPANFHPETVPGTGPIISVPSTGSTTSSKASMLGDDKDYFGTREGEDRFRSLTDLKWGEFESMGFGGLGADEKSLQFDLTEGARNARTAKRTTLSWNDFSSDGFTRSDDPLKATLQFSTPVSNTISTWPTHNAEISKKLKKTHRALPAFGWDTEPVMGSEEMVEEAFVDVFCDLVYGGGWMDLERGEEIDRDCNWALVEFKSMPLARSHTTTAGSDPRTATTIILFEEFVPFEYRHELAASNSGRRRFPSLFSASKKQWKPAPTLNGRPYAVGQVPHPASFRELEFEGLLRGSTPTKVISLASQRRSAAQTASRVYSFAPDLVTPRQSEERAHGSPVKKVKSNEQQSDPPATPQANKRLSRFRLPGGIPVPSPGAGRKTGMMPSEYSTVDFETRLASYSDDELNSGGKGRRESKDDAWVDILVGETQTRRLGGQDADFRKAGVWDLKGGISEPELPVSDPELASQEVAQALAAVRDLALPSDDDDLDMEPVHDEDTVDEIVTAPRNYDREYEHEYDHGYDHPYHPGYDDDDLEEEQQDEEPEPEHENETLAQKKRRLGYFDLHPERRPVSRSGDDDDPRARLHADSDEEPDDEAVYGAPSLPSVLPPRSAQFSADAELHAFGPTNSFPSGPRQIAIPEAELGGVMSSDLDDRFATDASVNLIPSSTSKTTPSKTAALIEMYREKERGVPTSTPQPSRLPVRSGSVVKDPVPASTVVAPELSLSPDDGEDGRYVHGAPLHNVLEEEEEEP